MDYILFTQRLERETERGHNEPRESTENAGTVYTVLIHLTYTTVGASKLRSQACYT